MSNTQYRRFYLISLGSLLLLSAYPVINGARMLALSLANGALQPGQLTRYVVPYAAICVALLLFAAVQPLVLRLRGRLALPVCTALVYGVFFAVEQVLENIQIRSNGLSSIDGFHPAPRLDMWQALSCYISPDAVKAAQLREQAFIGPGGFYYVVGNSAYKVHYYLISLILIVMACGFVYGLGKMFRDKDFSKKKSLALQGVSLGALAVICAFANLTGFFRTTAPIQTPLASVLTCLFFIVLGMAAGVYAGSLLLGRGRRLGLWLPAAVAALTSLLMYIGESVMMDGGLYRFGKGWFFEGLPGIPLAPVDALVILLSGAAVWLTLRFVRDGHKKAGIITGAAVSLITAVFVIICAGATAPLQLAPEADPAASQNSGLYGCYAFEENLYTVVYSSFIAHKDSMPVVYGLDENSLIIANTDTGDVTVYGIVYENTDIDESEFSSVTGLSLGFFPDLSRFKSRVRVASCTNGSGGQYRLYQMDDNLWLAQFGGKGEVGSVYRLERTGGTSLSDLYRALDTQGAFPSPPPSPATDERRMTLRDIYALARKGEALTFDDFAPFRSRAVGRDFSLLRYDAEGVLTVLCDPSVPSFSLTKQGYDPFDSAHSIDLTAGYDATTAYLDPLHSLMTLTIDDPYGGAERRELIYEFDGYRYFLNTTRADRVFVTFENGERLPIRQALEDRRIIIEDAVANGLYNVFMEPSDNPLGGGFSILHHLHRFFFDSELFYPSKSFMYTMPGGSLATYFDISELADILEVTGRGEYAQKLRQMDTSGLPVIGGRAYADGAALAGADITFEIGWKFSSHTPVYFSAGIAQGLLT